MLPIRKSLPVARRAHAIAVEVRVPALGIWFAAIAATVRSDGIFLSTFQDLPRGTRVELEIALPSGAPVHVAGVIAEHPLEGIGIDVAFDSVDEDVRERLASLAPEPLSGIRARVA